MDFHYTEQNGEKKKHFKIEWEIMKFRLFELVISADAGNTYKLIKVGKFCKIKIILYWLKLFLLGKKSQGLVSYSCKGVQALSQIKQGSGSNGGKQLHNNWFRFCIVNH